MQSRWPEERPKHTPFLLSWPGLILFLLISTLATFLHQTHPNGAPSARPQAGETSFSSLAGHSPFPEFSQQIRRMESVVVSRDTSASTDGHELLTELQLRQERKRLLTGTWRQEFFGERLLTINDDGTGRMLILPNSFWSSFFGDRIELRMYWTLEKDRIDYGYSGGTPAEKVESARKSWGDHWNEQIVELTEDRLVLLNADGKTRSAWQRVELASDIPTITKAAAEDRQSP